MVRSVRDSGEGGLGTVDQGVTHPHVDRLLSVDPGSVHVGVALWELHSNRWRCVSAKEVTPDEYADLIRRTVGQNTIGRVAYEVFRLTGGDEAARQRGSTFGMVELIGLTRHFCRWHGATIEGFERGNRKSALTRMKAVGWRFPRRVADHVLDAIAVGACATDWSAADHVPGDGMGGPEQSPYIVG